MLEIFASFYRLLIFINTSTYKMLSGIRIKSVTQFGFRSGPTFRWSYYGTKKFDMKLMGKELELYINGVARTLKKVRTSNLDYWIKQCFSSIASLFRVGNSLKGKNLPPEGANSFL